MTLDQQVDDQQVDDKGTDQEEARRMLTALRDRGFEGDNEKFALALGRSIEQVQAFIDGSETIDDDVVMKARGIALNRGESINAAWIVVAAACVYLLAYRFYSGWIAARVLALDATRATPAESLENGRDFVPTNRWIVFGHHFAAIAGAGPLVGECCATTRTRHVMQDGRGTECRSRSRRARRTGSSSCRRSPSWATSRSVPRSTPM